MNFSGKNILVTGGCGYIGSHVVRALSESGANVTVIDDLSTGNRDALLHGERLVEADFADTKALEAIVGKQTIDGVMHFAAKIVVEESVTQPDLYYRENGFKSGKLFEFCAEAGVRSIVYSSTAAVYGTQAVQPINESANLLPESPYGRSKLAGEWCLQDLSKSSGMRHVILRYFNVAGASPDQRIGQKGKKATHLIKVGLDAAMGLRDRMVIFGDDYETADGTCRRDFIHVVDLADVHLKAMDYLLSGGESRVLNCGYGHGYSVKEVVAKIRQVTGQSFQVDVGPRRPGDLMEVIADHSSMVNLFNWQPKYDDLETMIRHAFLWEQSKRA